MKADFLNNKIMVKGAISIVVILAVVWVFWMSFMWLRPKVWKKHNKEEDK